MKCQNFCDITFIRKLLSIITQTATFQKITFTFKWLDDKSSSAAVKGLGYLYFVSLVNSKLFFSAVQLVNSNLFFTAVQYWLSIVQTFLYDWITWDCSWYCSLQCCDCGKCYLLRCVLSRAALACCHHVGFQQSAFQEYIVVSQSFVLKCKHLEYIADMFIYYFTAADLVEWYPIDLYLMTLHTVLNMSNS